MTELAKVRTAFPGRTDHDAAANVIRVVENHSEARLQELDEEIAKAALRLATLTRERAELQAYEAIHHAFQPPKP